MGMKAEQWRQIILSFESKKTYNNPFLDVPSGVFLRDRREEGSEEKHTGTAEIPIGLPLRRPKSECGVIDWKHRRRQDFPECRERSNVFHTKEILPFIGTDS